MGLSPLYLVAPRIAIARPSRGPERHSRSDEHTNNPKQKFTCTNKLKSSKFSFIPRWLYVLHNFPKNTLNYLYLQIITSKSSWANTSLPLDQKLKPIRLEQAMIHSLSSYNVSWNHESNDPVKFMAWRRSKGVPNNRHINKRDKNVISLTFQSI